MENKVKVWVLRWGFYPLRDSIVSTTPLRLLSSLILFFANILRRLNTMCYVSKLFICNPSSFTLSDCFEVHCPFIRVYCVPETITTIYIGIIVKGSVSRKQRLLQSAELVNATSQATIVHHMTSNLRSRILRPNPPPTSTAYANDISISQFKIF